MQVVHSLQGDSPAGNNMQDFKVQFQTIMTNASIKSSNASLDLVWEFEGDFVVAIRVNSHEFAGLAYIAHRELPS